MDHRNLFLLRTSLMTLLLAGVIWAAPANGRGRKPPPPPPPPTPDCNVTYTGYTTRIAFSGYVWAVKDHGNSTAGPGPNHFSAGTGSVWVDSGGRLHMKIRRSKGKWYAAEVINLCTLGYGTYRFYLDSPVDALDPSVVLGIFTWSDQPADNHRELDIEFSRWSDPGNLNAQYVVQPYDQPGNIFRFSQPGAAPQTTQILTWTEGLAEFESHIGHSSPNDAGPLYASYTFANSVPESWDENPRINLWLFQGRPPTNGQDVEVIINRFEFDPAS